MSIERSAASSLTNFIPLLKSASALQAAPKPCGADHLSLEEDQHFATIFEHAGSGIAQIDADGRLRRVNAYLCELTGYSAGELLGRSIFDETFADDVEADRAQFRRQVAGEID